MQIIAVTNIKGGVGKTTTAVNLAYLCAAEGRNTLLWDLDPQGAASYILRCESNEHASAKKLVAGKRELPELLVQSGYDNLHVLPSDFSYRNFDVHLSSRKHPTLRLLKMSRSLRDVYAALILDCPPGISLLSENVLRAADAVVVPLLPTPLSVRMLTQLRDFIGANGWTDIKLLPFFSMVDRRKSLHRDVIAGTRERFPELLATEVPYSSDIERMSLRRESLPAYSPGSAAGIIYANLWKEVRARMQGPLAAGVTLISEGDAAASTQSAASPEPVAATEPVASTEPEVSTEPAAAKEPAAPTQPQASTPEGGASTDVALSATLMASTIR